MPDRVAVAYFEQRAHVHDALTRLAALGVDRQSVRMLPERAALPGDFVLRRGSSSGQGAAIGGLVGAVVGATLGALFAGASLIALGLVLAGPALSAFVVACALGAVGAALGAIVGAQRPRFRAELAADPTRAGTLVTVRSLGDVGPIERALLAAGAVHVHAR